MHDEGREWTRECVRYVVRTVKASKALQEAIWNEDAETVAKGIEEAHLENSYLQYNDENALDYTISLALYAARDYYTLVRELPSGKGYADMTFVPLRKHTDKLALLVELKWDKTAESAIDQIRDRRHVESLRDYKDNLLLLGVNYNRETREHSCVIERG